MVFLFTYTTTTYSQELLCGTDITDQLTDFYFEVGEENPNYFGDINTDEYVIEVDDEFVDYDQVSDNPYPLYYTIKNKNKIGLCVYQVWVYIMESINPPQLKFNADDQEFKWDVHTMIDETSFLEVVTAIDFKGDDISNLIEIVVVFDDDHTISISELDTSQFGSYELRYQVTDQLGQTSVIKSTLEIADLSEPTIQLNKNFELPYAFWKNDILYLDSSQSHLNYLPFFIFNDNYDHQLNIEFDDSTVNYGNDGEYEVYVKATDNSRNEATYDLSVKVGDYTPPVIEGLPEKYEFIIGKDQEISFLDGIKVIDAIDGELPIDTHLKLNKLFIDYTKVGIYPVDFIAFDKSGNEIIERRLVYVMDDTPTVIKGVEPLQLHKTNNSKRYIDLLEGVYVEGEGQIFVIDNKVNYEVPGTYEIKYLYIDRNGKLSSVYTTIKILEDTQEPEFKGLEKEIKITVYDEFDAKKGIIAYDEEWGEIEYEVIGEVNVNKLGSYTLTYFAIDPSGNSKEEKVIVQVVDDVAPIISGPTEIKIDVGTEDVNFLNWFKLTDNYTSTEKLKHTIIDDEFRIDTIGQYDLEIIVMDSSRNEAKHQFTVHVRDNESPIITMLEPIKIEYGETPNFNQYFELSDNYDNIDDLLIEYIMETAQLTQLGKHEMTIRVTDRAGNTVEKDVTFEVLDRTPPVFEGITNKTIRRGQSIDLLAGISAYDKVDGDLTDLIRIRGHYDMDKTGSYIIELLVRDGQGNQTIETFILTVKTNYYPFIYIISIISIIVASLIVLKIKLKRKPTQPLSTIEEDFERFALDLIDELDDEDEQFIDHDQH